MVTEYKVRKFPEHFLWGASSSAFQIEGAARRRMAKGRTVADVNAAKRAHLQADTRVASDFYHRFQEDIELFARLGLKAYRFPCPGPGLFPTGTARSMRPDWNSTTRSSTG